VAFNPWRITSSENELGAVLPQSAQFTDVIHVAKTNFEVYSDIKTQTLVCK
jgi:hypothetical protein